MPLTVLRTFLATFLLSLSSGVSLKAVLAQEPAKFHPGRVIVKFRENTPLLTAVRARLERRTGEIGFSPARQFADSPVEEFMREGGLRSLMPIRKSVSARPLPGGVDRLFVAELEADVDVTQAIRKLSRSSAFEYVEPDYIGRGGGVLESEPHASARVSSRLLNPNDPGFRNQWALLNYGQTMGGINGKFGADVNMTNAWDITTGSDGIILAVLDSGIPLNHPEFSGRLVPGYDFVNDDADPMDDHGHGTHVASVAAATGNNGNLIAGVDWRCKIMPLKVLNAQNVGFYSWWIAALQFAADSGAHVINMSLGGSDFSDALRDGIDYAASRGAIIVASMMDTNSEFLFFPAAYDNVIAVGATNNRDYRAAPFSIGGGSNYGHHIDFVAPGEYILGLHHTDPTRSVYGWGTSQAAAIVSGIVSLLLSQDNTLTFQQVYAALKGGAKDQVGVSSEDTPGWDKFHGWGRVDAFESLNYLSVLASGNDFHLQPIPESVLLHQNFPNPFNPSTTIRFHLPSPGHVSLTILDPLGRHITTLVDGVKNAGVHNVVWTPTVASGIYYYRLQAGNVSQTKRLLLLK